MRHLSFCFLIICSFPLLGEEVLCRDWNEGPIQSKDFQGSYLPLGAQSSNVIFRLALADDTERRGDSIFKIKRVQNLIDQSQSSLSPEADTLSLFRFYQVCFDLYELYRRKAQKEIHPEARVSEYPKILLNYQAEALNQLNRLRIETAYGTKLASLEQWEQDLAQQLEQEKAAPLPTLTRTNKPGLALDFGMLAQVYQGQIGNYLNPSSSFSMALGINYQKFDLWFSLNSGAASLKRTYVNSENTWGQNEALRLHQVQLNLSYCAYKKDRSSLHPFIGYSSLELDAAYDPNLGFAYPYETYYLGINQWQIGAVYKFRMQQYFRTNHPYWLLNQAYQLEHHLNLGLSFCFNESREMPGGSVNLRISYSFDQRPLNLKN